MLTGPQILKDATTFFSRGGTPHLATVIPAIDLIDERFASYTVDMKLSPAIRAAVATAKRTLNRYYEKTDQSEVYRIAMGASLALPIPPLPLINNSCCSATPSSQAGLLPASGLGAGLDRNRSKHRACGI
jgi:hypothetical protein